MHAPIIIIAAPRSGTNLLRNLLCTHSELVTWPCDEINPIWRYRNTRFLTDELLPRHATPDVKRYIRAKFETLSQNAGGRIVVEKTCANSLRIGFVQAVFPEARFIHLVRDGRDAAASTRRRWMTEEPIRYLLEKVRWIPIRDLPHHGWAFISNRIHKLAHQRFHVWGPVFDGLDQLLASRALIEVCGAQWKECVEKASRGLNAVPKASVFEIRYEALVERPHETFESVLSFLGLEMETSCEDACEDVTKSNIGKGVSELSREEMRLLTSLIQPTLKRLGYLQ